MSVPSARKEAPIPPLQGLLVSGVRSSACRGAFPFGVRRKAPARLRPFPYRIRFPARGEGPLFFLRGRILPSFPHKNLENLGQF